MKPENYISWILSNATRKYYADKSEYLPELIEASVKYFLIDKKELFSARRYRHLVDPRRMISMFAINELRAGWTDVGLATNKDHSTIVAHRRQGTELLEYDKEFRNRYEIYHDHMKKALGFKR
jgi:chromosomal replication initiation ATPase DnaA